MTALYILFQALPFVVMLGLGLLLPILLVLGCSRYRFRMDRIGCEPSVLNT